MPTMEMNIPPSKDIEESENNKTYKVSNNKLTRLMGQTLINTTLGTTEVYSITP